MKGWHFVRENGRLGYGDDRLVEAGIAYQQPDMSREPELCDYGMHASKRIIDALRYAPGSILCRVDIPDPIIGADKMVGRERTVLWMVDVTAVLHEFACRCAESALELVGNPNPLSVAAIAMKRRWLAGEATDEELAAAREAALAAAVEAAWAAAGTAAAKHAAAAERAAAGVAAAAAAAAAAAERVAARAAAAERAAAGEAAWAAMWAATRARQNRQLTSMVVAEAKRQGVYR